MNHKTRNSDGKIFLCICPFCKKARKKVSGKFNIIKRGYERNKLARFFCRNCQKWFNEKTGKTMGWLER